MQLNESSLGFEIYLGSFLIFFGKKNASLETLKSKYTDLQWGRIRQTHSDVIVESNINICPEADAHWTSASGLALPIATADCAPIMLVDSSRKVVAAIHAGWRGVANRILPKTLDLLIKQGSSAKNIYVFIGPHIQKQSFEVEKDVMEKLITAASAVEVGVVDSVGEKYLVDLHALLKMQVAEFMIPADQVFSLHLDTFVDLDFHSFRRERERAGRQVSFVTI